MALEKSLQTLFEANLDALLGIRFLASEFVTNEGGRMDKLGIDENNAPVVIEYKRSSNENVINQGLFYLDWLMGHRKDFEWLVMESLGKEVANKVD
jgi:RecB family endonuclease NucS